ncbi:MAG: PA2779 family protein [Rubrivivax sp.]|nr:PA2779 family protein [Rubrivivax sp.]
MSIFRRVTATVLSASIVFSGMAYAAPSSLIGTEQLAAATAPVEASDSRARLLGTLERADLVAALEARGVSVSDVRSRVDALTDAEAAQLLVQIDQAPAGADIVGVLFTVFIILLVTDILGLTKIFPFTRSVR